MEHHTRRRRYNVALSVSLAVLLMTCLLWLRSVTGGQDFLTYGLDRAQRDPAGSEGVEIGLVTHREEISIGEARIQQGEGAPRPDEEAHAWHSSWFGEVGSAFNTLGDARSFLGFGLTLDGEYPWFGNVTGTVVTIPYWLLGTASATLPGFAAVNWWRQSRRQRRTRLGLCLACGYDLRESRDRGPECGSTASPALQSPRCPTPLRRTRTASHRRRARISSSTSTTRSTGTRGARRPSRRRGPRTSRSS